MIYRFKTFLDSSRIQPKGEQFGPMPPGLNQQRTVVGDYKLWLEKQDYNTEFERFKAPLIPSWRAPATLNLNIKHGRMLDVYQSAQDFVVSEQAKNCIEMVDANVHQFIPINVVNDDGEPVDKKRYFSLSIRRLFKTRGFSQPGASNTEYAYRQYLMTEVEKKNVFRH